MRRTMLAVPTAVLALSLLAACGQEDDTAADPAADETTSQSPSDEPTESESTEEESSGSGVSCDFAADQMGEPAKDVTPPPTEAGVSGQVEAVMQTSAGDLTATLDADATPCTVESFLSLAEQGYFDDTPCHRLTTQGIFVLQCGDPTGTGTGGPGYTVPDELSGEETYGPGTLAMANTGAPDSGGSQFFIVYDGEDAQLPPSYAVFGQLDEASTQVVADLAAQGTVDGGPDGAPQQEVTIEGVTTG